MESRQDGAEDWASQIADAVRSELRDRAATQRLHGIELQSVQAVSPTAVEVVWACRGGDGFRGLRLLQGDVRSASLRIRESDPRELAFDLVVVGMREPRSNEEFTAPDAEGIRWLPVEAWLDP